MVMIINIQKILKLQFDSIEKTLKFSTLLMITCLSFIVVNKINNINTHLAVEFMAYQQMFLPVWFFGMFDGGFKDISYFGYMKVFKEKVIQIFVVNFVFLIFIEIISGY